MDMQRRVRRTTNVELNNLFTFPCRIALVTSVNLDNFDNFDSRDNLSEKMVKGIASKVRNRLTKVNFNSHVTLLIRFMSV